MAHYEKPDYWSQKAKKEGYPARSVYKLMEIDEKFNFFKSSRQKKPVNQAAFRVLDLGAAPGSWSLYVLRKYGKPDKENRALSLTAVDLQPLYKNDEFPNYENFLFIQGDFTGIPVRETLISNGPYNAIISDAAPLTTGSRTVDTQRSLSLVEEAFFYAENCLAPGGNLAVKIFQSGDTTALLKHLRENFTTAKSFKPTACRSNSFETYLIGLGKKTTTCC